MSDKEYALPGLHGKVAIVTGSRGGIGAATVKRLEALGVRVHGFDLPDVDLADPRAIEANVERVASAEGRLDLLVNNAGITRIGTALEATVEEIDAVFAVNFRAPLLLMKAAIPHMIRQGGGAIVNNASDQAFVGKRGSAIYGASKAALAQLTRGSALDWAEHGVRVNCVAPGSTDTAMLRDVFKLLGERYGVKSESDYTASIPQKRLASPDEIAWAIAFLCSDAASFITGVVLPVDGGFTAQ